MSPWSDPRRVRKGAVFVYLPRHGAKTAPLTVRGSSPCAVPSAQPGAFLVPFFRAPLANAKSRPRPGAALARQIFWRNQ